MSKLKQSATGPMHVIVDDKKPGVLSLKNLNKGPTGFNIQLYEPKGFEIRPDKGLLAPKQIIDLEMRGGQAAMQSFHIACVEWPASSPQFNQALWKKLEATKRSDLQVLAFGNPPTYAGIYDASVKEAPSPGKEGVCEGPKLIVPHIPKVSFKPPDGKPQTVTVRIKNVTTKPAAFKIMTNRGTFYGVNPGAGILDGGKHLNVDIEQLETFTLKNFEIDKSGHQLHLMAIKWPKKVEEYHPNEWKRLEKARKDQKGRFIIAINHNGEPNAPAEVMKAAADLTYGPDLVEVTPKKMMVTPPTTKAHTISIENKKPSVVVAYKVMTNKPKFYIINHTKGILKGGEKLEVKVEINPQLTVKDMSQESDLHQILVLAVPWQQAQFDNDEFARLQKAKRALQSVCVEVLLELESANKYVTSFPTSLSYMQPTGVPQTVSVTLGNKADKAVAFKMEAMHPIMNKFYTVQPETGVVKKGNASTVKFTLTGKAKKASDLPTDPAVHCFKLIVIGFPLDQFNDDLFKEYETYKKADLQIIKLHIDFDATQPAQPAEAPSMSTATMGMQNPEQLMQAMMMLQQMQMQGMMATNQPGAAGAGAQTANSKEDEGDEEP